MARPIPASGPGGGPTDAPAANSPAARLHGATVVRIERGPLGMQRSGILASGLALACLGIWLALPSAAPIPTAAPPLEPRHRGDADPVDASPRAGVPDPAVATADTSRGEAAAQQGSSAGSDPAHRAARQGGALPHDDALRRAQRPGRTRDGQFYRPDPKSDAEIDAALDAAERGDTTGIGVFPAPGTKPVKSGLIVPEGVELPPGYVRHYQTTDDGRMLPPILAYHPDHTPTDSAGNPLPRPPGGVVPPDQAPEGLRGGEILVPPSGEVDPIQAPVDRAGPR